MRKKKHNLYWHQPSHQFRRFVLYHSEDPNTVTPTEKEEAGLTKFRLKERNALTTTTTTANKSVDGFIVPKPLEKQVMVRLTSKYAQE